MCGSVPGGFSKLKVRFFSEITDVFVITLNRQTFFFPETENCLEIEDVLKFESLEPCKGKKAALKIIEIQIFSFREEKYSSV